MFRIFQLITETVLFSVMLASAVFCTPLAGNTFAPEWELALPPRDNGSIKEFSEHYKEGDIVHVFDGGGRKILRTYPDAKSRKKIEFKMSYRPDGRLSEVKCFSDGSLLYSEHGQYDESGILRGICRKNAAGEVIFATTMLLYDEKTKKLKMYGIQYDGMIVDYFYDLTPSGQLAYVRALVNNKLTSAVRYKYNEKGVISEMSRYNERGQSVGILKYEWKFDEKGNWTEKKSLMYPNEKAKPVFGELVRRTIKY